MIKSQIEALQYFANDYSKIKRIQHDKNEDIKELYHLRFEELTVEEFVESYDYLLREREVVQLDSVRSEEMNIWEFIIRNETMFVFDPYVAVLRNHSPISNLKIIKIYTNKWFPNMNPSTFPKEVYNFVMNIMRKDIDSTIKYIPFP